MFRVTGGPFSFSDFQSGPRKISMLNYVVLCLLSEKTVAPDLYSRGFLAAQHVMGIHFESVSSRLFKMKQSPEIV